ncbi:MAG: 16S rRNA (guanine(527)-N(7))-methyltransferase RsmG [Bacteroidales bacterium]|nr:16S rRNA (guanine(527)-N(7))-methyltransferase RsmG [Bacteroidales bacterium]
MTYDQFSKIVLAEFPGLTAEQMELFKRMEPLYLDWNSRINVISRKDIDGFYEHHVLHSLAIASYWLREGIIPEGARLSVLDVGTGGGFPGIPLAVLFPQMQFTLCDSVGKKTIVASAVAEALGLDNVTVVNARAESLPATYDLVVSRAVTSLDNFYPWVRDRFKYSIFYLKGGDINEEIALLMGRNRLKKGSVRTWRVDNWLEGEYFQEKFVIQIEKDYLCSPFVE